MPDEEKGLSAKKEVRGILIALAVVGLLKMIGPLGIGKIQASVVVFALVYMAYARFRPHLERVVPRQTVVEGLWIAAWMALLLVPPFIDARLSEIERLKSDLADEQEARNEDRMDTRAYADSLRREIAARDTEINQSPEKIRKVTADAIDAFIARGQRLRRDYTNAERPLQESSAEQRRKLLVAFDKSVAGWAKRSVRPRYESEWEEQQIRYPIDSTIPDTSRYSHDAILENRIVQLKEWKSDL